MAFWGLWKLGLVSKCGEGKLAASLLGDNDVAVHGLRMASG
jgi:hypothetical protein